MLTLKQALKFVEDKFFFKRPRLQAPKMTDELCKSKKIEFVIYACSPFNEAHGKDKDLNHITRSKWLQECSTLLNSSSLCYMVSIFRNWHEFQSNLCLGICLRVCSSRGRKAKVPTAQYLGRPLKQ